MPVSAGEFSLELARSPTRVSQVHAKLIFLFALLDELLQALAIGTEVEVVHDVRSPIGPLGNAKHVHQASQCDWTPEVDLRVILVQAFEVLHVGMLINEALGLGQAAAVDHAGVVEFISDDCVRFPGQKRDSAGIGAPAGDIGE